MKIRLLPHSSLCLDYTEKLNASCVSVVPLVKVLPPIEILIERQTLKLRLDYRDLAGMR